MIKVYANLLCVVPILSAIWPGTGCGGGTKILPMTENRSRSQNTDLRAQVFVEAGKLKVLGVVCDGNGLAGGFGLVHQIP